MRKTKQASQGGRRPARSSDEVFGDVAKMWLREIELAASAWPAVHFGLSLGTLVAVKLLLRMDAGQGWLDLKDPSLHRDLDRASDALADRHFEFSRTIPGSSAQAATPLPSERRGCGSLELRSISVGVASGFTMTPLRQSAPSS